MIEIIIFKTMAIWVPKRKFLPLLRNGQQALTEKEVHLEAPGEKGI